MNKNDIAAFFDSCAPWWDADMIRNEAIISEILTNSGVHSGIDVLDVACGTGVLFPDYIERDVKSITAIDISPEMVKIAKSKFPDIDIICGDVERYHFNKTFDTVMVYNAFPHFPSPERLIAALSSLVKSGGYLSIAHGMSRKALLEHHKRAGAVSIPLPEALALSELLAPYFDVKTVISDDKMYQVVGIRK